MEARTHTQRGTQKPLSAIAAVSLTPKNIPKSLKRTLAFVNNSVCVSGHVTVAVCVPHFQLLELWTLKLHLLTAAKGSDV